MALPLNNQLENPLLDNVLCYIAGFIVQQILRILPCQGYKQDFLLNAAVDSHKHHLDKILFIQ